VRISRRRIAVLTCLLLLSGGCQPDQQESESIPEPPTSTTPIGTDYVAAGPRILGATASASGVGLYELFELAVELDADFENAYDQREVALDATFEGPGGIHMAVPGFWDGRDSWRVRFTPSEIGSWTYRLTVTDGRGSSSPIEGAFDVRSSELHGWLQVGSWVDPSYSPHYLAYHDGTPWYGRGHADLQMSLGGLGEDGFQLFTEMPGNGENYAMWWPMWANNIMARSYDDYSVAQMELIDLVLEDADAKGVTLAYTIWTHQHLRTNDHTWGRGKWLDNGFRHLTDLPGFFTDREAWAWQENYYRYTIARWGYSPAISIWQTITEINGTESYAETDRWHEKLNAYFQENDPYRHPTTATQSGSVDWPQAHRLMDVPQMHVYEFVQDPIEAAERMAMWTSTMWDREEKPNWIGEYGEEGDQFYPELFHHSNWASLAAGAAMTPIEWNDGRAYGRFTPTMGEDMARLAAFVDQIPLVTLNPVSVGVSSAAPAVRGWGVAGEDGGLIWVQDFSLQGFAMEEIRADESIRTGVEIAVDGPSGTWLVIPYDTWLGEWMDPIEVECPSEGSCLITLPDFHSDLALRLTRP
jgi:hypothetical protein